MFPQETIQTTALNQPDAIIAPFRQLLQQGFNHRVHTRLATGTNSQHLQAQLAGSVVRFQQLLQSVFALDRLEKFRVGLGHLGELQAQLQFGQPDSHLVSPELAVGQLHIQQPVIQILRLWPLLVQQEFLFR